MESAVTPRERKKLDALKFKLSDLHITYRQIAEARGCSWHQVWRVMNGHRKSAPVIEVAERLIASSLSA